MFKFYYNLVSLFLFKWKSTINKYIWDRSWAEGNDNTKAPQNHTVSMHVQLRLTFSGNYREWLALTSCPETLLALKRYYVFWLGLNHTF